jgi:hypothetical protein
MDLVGGNEPDVEAASILAEPRWRSTDTGIAILICGEVE